MTADEDYKLLTPAQTEARFGWKAGRLKTWRRRGKGPPWFGNPSPRIFFYRAADVLRWLNRTARPDVEQRIALTAKKGPK